MGLILRLDVDKPYGNHTLARKIASKLVEDYPLPAPKHGYLDHVRWTLDLLAELHIPAIFYFRSCTTPDEDLLERLTREGHALGFHAENTRSLDCLRAELEEFRRRVGQRPLHSFSKHGSGYRKLGRFHYPPYEPVKYLTWASELGVPFPYGNDPMPAPPPSGTVHHPTVFWIEHGYRSPAYSSPSQAVRDAADTDLPVLTHPENLIRDRKVLGDLRLMAAQAQERQVPWTIPSVPNTRR